MDRFPRTISEASGISRELIQRVDKPSLANRLASSIQQNAKKKNKKTKIVPINTGNLNSRISKAISKGTPSKKKIVPVVNAQTTNRLYTAITESTAAKMKPVPKSIRQNKKRTKSKTNEIIYQLII